MKDDSDNFYTDEIATESSAAISHSKNLSDGAQNEGAETIGSDPDGDKADKKKGRPAIQKVTASQKNSEKGDERKKKKKYNIWWIKATVISLVLAAFFSFLSELTASAKSIIIILLLLGFLILASILFDAIGVAVTSCDAAPIISMASRKIYGSKTALWLVKNSGTVSSICNDVIGDIFGIISGACSAAIVLKITVNMDSGGQRWITIAISAVVSALTIGGKAFMKNVAISNSRDFVMFVARMLAVFNRDERKIRKKEAKKRAERSVNADKKESDKSETSLKSGKPENLSKESKADSVSTQDNSKKNDVSAKVVDCTEQNADKAGIKGGRKDKKDGKD